MSDKLDELMKLEAQLRAQLREVEQKRITAVQQAEEERKKRPVTITIDEVRAGRYVVIHLSDAREDIIRILNFSYQSGSMKGNTVWSIFIKEYKKTIDQLQSLPNIEFKDEKEVTKQITDILDGPRFFVDKIDGKMTVRPSVMASSYVLHDIPSANQRPSDDHWTINLIEAYRIPEVLREENVRYSDEAAEYIANQVRKRLTLDIIAQKMDSEINIQLHNDLEMRGFQKVAVEFAEEAGGNIIEGDEMGLGKTWVAVATSLRNKWKTLIICPASLKQNWYREIVKLTGEQPTILQGSVPDEFDIAKLMIDRPNWVIMNYDMIGKRITEKVVKKDEFGYENEEVVDKWPWCRLINLAGFDHIWWDEAHYVKNVDSNRSRASRQLKPKHQGCMTGTPILNRPGELWALLALTSPELFPNHEQFVLRYTHDGKTARNTHELRNLLKSVMIRRLKRDVLGELPPINRIQEWHELSSEGKKKHDLAMAGIYEVLRTFNPSQADERWNITNMLVQLMRCKQICANDKLERTAELANEAYDSSDPNDANRKIIIFSQFLPCVHDLAGRLREEGVVSFTGEDAMYERTKMQDEFQNNERIKYLVTTPRVASEGLNLTRAGTVIFNDLEWTPARHEQAEARAYGRMSNLHSVNSIYLLCEKSIEEDIWELLAAKMRIITDIVEGVKDARDEDSSVVTELIKRLKERHG